jgi:hypothetical protein
MRLQVAVLAIVPCVFGICGCGGGTAPTDAGSASEAGQSGQACSDDTECTPNQVCGYLQSAACAAHGECVARAYDGGVPPGGCILAYSCGCDGGTIDYNVFCASGMSGYVSVPILHTGACVPDGG